MNATVTYDPSGGRILADASSFHDHCAATNTKPTKKLLRMWHAALAWERSNPASPSVEKLRLLESILND